MPTKIGNQKLQIVGKSLPKMGGKNWNYKNTEEGIAGNFRIIIARKLEKLKEIARRSKLKKNLQKELEKEGYEQLKPKPRVQKEESRTPSIFSKVQSKIQTFKEQKQALGKQKQLDIQTKQEQREKAIENVFKILT
jgi:hypothetical protein